MTEPVGPDPVERALRHLADGPSSASWREPVAIRRVVQRRRRVAFAASTAGAVVVAVVVTLAVVLPGGSGLNGPATPVHVASGLHVAARSGAGVQLVADTKPLPATDRGAEAAVAKSEQAFTLSLLKQVDAPGSTGNVVLSPSSLAIALAMLQTGAAGSTQHQIATTLHTSGLTAEQQDAGWAALTADLASTGERSGVTVQSANSLWLQQNLPMTAQFMTAMARYFRTGVWQVDFAQHLGAAEKSLNAWVAKQTHGKITKLFNPGDLTPETALVLANAVYFKGAWKHGFDADQTRDGRFTTADGNKITVPFMRYNSDAFPRLRTNATAFRQQTDDYDAVQLPYQGGRFATLAIMPKRQSLREFVDGLTPQSLSAITGGLRKQQPIDLRMPKFTLSQYTKLNPVLAAMGMPAAFSDAADFSAMSPKPLQVQTVAQRAYLKVDEHGTEAAAVTGVGMIATSAPAVRTITFDHPFLFLVRDTKTGAIMFAAQVQNPGQ